ncbi:tetratricopeptide repeat protein [Bernardetia sp. OM2101]|uniref:tetratricopeptide repeat protein n=1 Tax=Bernardetia sp. OM2101 TaxID=3344876 RepID=UPI0035D12B57
MKKYILFFLVSSFYLLVNFSVIAQTASIPHSLDEAISLFNAGNHNEAKTLLRQNLEHDPDDSDSRSVLGKMNYHLGEWKTAIDIWSEGLNGKPSDFVFHMNIGNVFFEKAEQNAPSIYLKTYSETEIEEKSELYEQDFIKNTSPSFLKYWQEGINAYQAAYKIYPYEEYVLERLGEFYEMNRRFDSTFIYYKQLAELYPENSHYLTNAAIYQAKIKTSNQKEQDSLDNLVVERLNYSLKVDAQNPDTYRELARILTERESIEKNTQEGENDENHKKEEEVETLPSLEMIQKADFYASIPKFARFEFSKENALILDKLLTKSYSQKKNWSKLLDSLIHTISDKNNEKDISTQNLLITVLAADASDSELMRTFNNYYSLFRERKNIINTLANTHYGQWLLIQLLQETKEIKLTRDVTTTLVRKKSPNMHDVLIDLLEYDYLPESMDIAKNLSKLNDERSRTALIKELYLPLPKTSAKWKNRTYYALQVRQMRAILALSALEKDEEIKQELVKGLERPDVRLFCAVALYSQTRNKAYLKLAKKYKPKKVPFPELGQFLKKFNDSKANSLGDKLIKG